MHVTRDVSGSRGVMGILVSPHIMRRSLDVGKPAQARKTSDAIVDGRARKDRAGEQRSLQREGKKNLIYVGWFLNRSGSATKAETVMIHLIA